MTEPEDKYSDFLILGGSHMLWLSGTHSGQDQRTRIHFFLRSSHSFMSGPEDQGSYVLIVRALLQDLWGTSSGQDQRTRINFFLFFERQSLIYDRTRGPGLICFDCEALLQGRTRGPGSNFLIFLKDSHSFMTGPKDQGSYVLIMRHYFRGGPEDQEPDFDFFERQSLIYDRNRGPGLICFDCEAHLQVRTRGPGSNFLIFCKTVTLLRQDQRTRVWL